jgi:MFS family permease
MPPVPSNIRFVVLSATALVATKMYLDRVCISQVADLFGKDLDLEPWQTDWVLGAFFWSYALGQVPAAWLGGRIGFRHALTIYLVVWSVFTAATGLATGFVVLVAARLLVGLAQAGGYPTAASLLRGWFPLASRGRASSAVALGGRLGWALAQLCTPPLLLALAVYAVVPWRGVLVCYGGLGLLVALVFWLLARDSPHSHPWSNLAEAELVGNPPPGKNDAGLSLVVLASSLNMWLSSTMQFCVNLAWVFLITLLPLYLTEAFGVPVEERGVMASLPAWVSCCGMFMGGFVTDALTWRFGLRWGRALPLCTMMAVCASAYLACVWLKSPWAVVAALAVMGMGVDLSNPATWAFAQDVGGRNAGAALGWGNMWGNFGAALSPVVLGAIQRRAGWEAVFATCAAAFVLAGCCALLLDASRPLLPADTGEGGKSR